MSLKDSNRFVPFPKLTEKSGKRDTNSSLSPRNLSYFIDCYNFTVHQNVSLVMRIKLKTFLSSVIKQTLKNTTKNPRFSHYSSKKKAFIKFVICTINFRFRVFSLQFVLSHLDPYCLRSSFFMSLFYGL